MRNLTLITLLLLFFVLYSAISRIFNSNFYNARSIEIVKEINEHEGFERCLKLPSLVNTGACCLICVHPGPLKIRKPQHIFSSCLLKQDILFTHSISLGENEYTQPDLLELHNTKEITIGYFLML